MIFVRVSSMIVLICRPCRPMNGAIIPDEVSTMSFKGAPEGRRRYINGRILTFGHEHDELSLLGLLARAGAFLEEVLEQVAAGLVLACQARVGHVDDRALELRDGDLGVDLDVADLAALLDLPQDLLVVALDQLGVGVLEEEEDREAGRGARLDLEQSAVVLADVSRLGVLLRDLANHVTVCAHRNQSCGNQRRRYGTSHASGWISPEAIEMNWKRTF